MRSQEISVRRYRRPFLASTVTAAALLLAAGPGTTARAVPPTGTDHARPRAAGLPGDYDETACEGPSPDEGDIYSRPPVPGPESDPPGGKPARPAPSAPARPPERAPHGSAAGAAPAHHGRALSKRVSKRVPTRWPRNLPGRDEATRMLADLDVRPLRGEGYDRRYFGATCWARHGLDQCTTREVALKLYSVVPATLQGKCRVVGGQWHSEYDNRTLADPVHVDVDHVVSLRNAWGAGAREWPAEKRLEFANDLTASPELIVVSTWGNRRKGDKSPDQWLPQDPLGQCLYSQAWIGVKDYYGLSVTRAEKDKLRQVLDACPDRAPTDGPGRPSRPNRPDHQPQGDHPDRQPQGDRQDRPGRQPQGDRQNRPDRPDHQKDHGGQDRQDRPDHQKDHDRQVRPDRNDRHDRDDRDSRDDR
ncbi:GmrSD restriction endonuclease domain-containing protein [Streptomyces sp. L500]